MTVDQFISIFGSQNALARDIGERESTVRAWMTRNSIPPSRDPKIIAAALIRGRAITPTDMYHLRRALEGRKRLKQVGGQKSSKLGRKSGPHEVLQ